MSTAEAFPRIPPISVGEVADRLSWIERGLRATRAATQRRDTRQALAIMIAEVDSCRKALVRLGAPGGRTEAKYERKTEGLQALEGGQSIRQVADRMGVSPGTVNAWKNPRTPVKRQGAQHNSVAYKNKNRPGERHCPRHNDGAGAWLPVDQFDRKGRTVQLRWCCRTCYAEYQAHRYVAANKRAIIVEIVDGDEIVGAVCNGCGKPFQIGQLVKADRLRHEECGFS